MVQRAARIAQFVSDRDPEANVMVQVLCEDHVGTYTLPFMCTKAGSHWISAATSEVLDAEVLGWRYPPMAQQPKVHAGQRATESLLRTLIGFNQNSFSGRRGIVRWPTVPEIREDGAARVFAGLPHVPEIATRPLQRYTAKTEKKF